MEKIILKQREAIILFFLFIFIIFTIFIAGIYTSRVGVEIENLKIDTERPKGEKINKDSKIYIYIIAFGKIKLFKKNIKDMNNGNIKFKNKDIDIKFFKDRDLNIDYKDLLKKINIYFEEINLNIQLSTENAALTSILIGIIATGIGLIIRQPKYEIIPIYANKNFIKIQLDCIFSVHLMQYIYKLAFNKIKEFREYSNKKVEV